MFDRRSVLIGLPGLLVACSKRGGVDLESAVEGALESPLGDSLGSRSLTAGDSGPVETPGYPYHPLIFHLDLAVLAYQLYGQSLVFPFDPYYEAMGTVTREAMMKRVRTWAQGAPDHELRGPGALAGLQGNAAHDPILYRYTQLQPWDDCLNFPGDSWLHYQAPAEITGRIGSVAVHRRPHGGAQGEVEAVALDVSPPASAGKDRLYAFEGGTGGTLVDRTLSWSLMGCVLMRHTDDGGYDVHIAFRGSRSGSATRAAALAVKDNVARGNPDWITDMRPELIDAGDPAGGRISTVGSVSAGFAIAMEACLPQILHCLEDIAARSDGRAPGHITVTGHSLGGALAQHFASAMLLGDSPPSGVLADWPWAQLKLVSLSAPRAGGEIWAKALTEALGSDFQPPVAAPVDPAAKSPADAELARRLTDPEGAAAFRVLVSHDPITSEQAAGIAGKVGFHVGETVYANADAFSPEVLVRAPSFDGHEIEAVRSGLMESISDARAPGQVWAYPEASTLGDVTPADAGAGDAARRRAEVIQGYYQAAEITFDAESRAADLKQYLSFVEG